MEGRKGNIQILFPVFVILIAFLITFYFYNLYQGQKVGIDSLISMEKTSNQSSSEISKSKNTAQANQKKIRLAVILANFPDKKEQPKTPGEINNIVFGEGQSVKKYFLENSYDLIDIEGDVFGWFTISKQLTSCDDYQWGNDALNEARLKGIDIDSYDFRIVAVPDYSTKCPAWERAYLTEKLVVINIEALSPLREIAHELGHLMGAQHAHLVRCPMVIERYDNCQIENTQDPFDAMGYTNYVSHFSAANKVGLGWIGQASIIEVKQSGTYTIKPLEYKDEPLILKIPKLDTKQNYLISYRQRIGYDSDIPFWENLDGVSIQIFEKIGENSFLEPLLIDANPDINFAGDINMNDNQTITDVANGISIKQISHNERSATVEVNFLQ